MMSNRTTKIIVYIIVIAMILSSFSFIFFLTPANGTEARNVYGTSLSTQTLYGQLSAQEQRLLRDRLNELESYIRFIQENFKDEVDLTTLIDGAFEGSINALGDPYSFIFTSPEAGQGFMENVLGEYVGIGVTITLNAEGLCRVEEAIVGGPAEAAGIRSGDLIIRIDGQELTGKNINEIAALLRGEIGTAVAVTVLRSGTQREFTITRERISQISVEYEILDGNIGYILIKSFNLRTARDFRDARAYLVRNGATSLIIDLRNNSGGLINVAIDVANELISEGYVVHLKARGEVLESISATGGARNTLNTVLLVNEYSASASEILAGALQDNGVATLVGNTTFGKGVAQAMEYTSGGMSYNLSVFHFVTPNYNIIHDRGIMPDYVVRNSLGELRVQAQALFETFAPFAGDVRPEAGDTGLNVFAAQQRLALLGFDVNLTATMDEQTVNAVMRFQSENELWSYARLDFTTMRVIDEVTLAYINNDSEEDLQLLKAKQLLQQVDIPETYIRIM